MEEPAATVVAQHNCFGGNGGSANAQATGIARDQVTISATAIGGNGGTSAQLGQGAGRLCHSIERRPWSGSFWQFGNRRHCHRIRYCDWW